jgi:hypothetical protein
MIQNSDAKWTYHPTTGVAGKTAPARYQSRGSTGLHKPRWVEKARNSQLSLQECHHATTKPVPHTLIGPKTTRRPKFDLTVAGAAPAGGSLPLLHHQSVALAARSRGRRRQNREAPHHRCKGKSLPPGGETPSPLSPLVLCPAEPSDHDGGQGG